MNGIFAIYAATPDEEKKRQMKEKNPNEEKKTPGEGKTALHCGPE